jgi:hypothetical protein
VVRRDVVAAKAGRARVWLNDASAILADPLDQFLADPKSRDVAISYLFLAIQECIDLAAHWVADEGWGEPDDAGSAFDALADRQVIEAGHGHGVARRDPVFATESRTVMRCSIMPGCIGRLRPAFLHYARSFATTQAAGA